MFSSRAIPLRRHDARHRLGGVLGVGPSTATAAAALPAPQAMLVSHDQPRADTPSSVVAAQRASAEYVKVQTGADACRPPAATGRGARVRTVTSSAR